MVFKPKLELQYMYQRPIKIKWKVVAGGELSVCQDHDLVFDETDLRIRQIHNKDNMIYLNEAQRR